MRRRRRTSATVRAALAALAGVAVLAAVVLALQLPVPAHLIEERYANGLFAALNRTLVPFTNAFPFALGDLLWIGGPIVVLWWWIATIRHARGGRVAAMLRLAGASAALAALGLVWFNLAWALNYRRETVVARVAMDRTRVDDRSVAAFGRRVVDELNRTAPLAHRALTIDDARVTALRLVFIPVVRRLGDRWDVTLTRPKTTAVDLYFRAAGIGGMYDPPAFETLLNASFLPWEMPRALAHEWAHVAGFTDEGDANYIGTLACLRSHDPLVRYSGWFWTYAELPADLRAKLTVTPLVRADLVASRERYLRWYRPQLFAISWHLYDRYLTSYHVAGGVRSYGRFLELLVGVPLDEGGLPRVRPPARGGSV